MAKYSKGTKKAVKSAITRMEKGTLKSGKSGKKVTNPKQAIAIGFSEAKEKGAKVPPKRSVSTLPEKASKKVLKKAVKKEPAKKTATKASAKKAATVKVKKTAATKIVVAKKGSLKKESSSKKPVKKTITEKTVVIAAGEPVYNKVIPTPENRQPVEEKSPLVFQKTADPIMRTDKNLLKTITTKRDLQHNIKLSQSKSPIRPSGKKPLFSR